MIIDGDISAVRRQIVHVKLTRQYGVFFRYGGLVPIITDCVCYVVAVGTNLRTITLQQKELSVKD